MSNLKLIFLILGLALIAFSLIGFSDIQRGVGLIPSSLVYSIPTEGPQTLTPLSVTTEAPTSTPLPSPVPLTPTSMALFVLPQSFPGTHVVPLGTPVLILGKHVVQGGEWLFCIGRAYGVSPRAIAEINSHNLNDILLVGEVLLIPDIQWDVSHGSICTPQFKSPHSPTPIPTVTPNIYITPVSRHPVVPGESYDRKEDSISGELRLINFALPREQIKKVSSQSVLLAGNATSMLTEDRIVSVESPCEMPLEASGVVILHFDTPATITATASATTTPSKPVAGTPNNNLACTHEPNPISILDKYDDYNVFANARLDAAGFIYAPKEDMQLVSRGQKLTWQWSIKPQDVGQQTLIVSLRLHFEPKSNNDPIPDQQIWIDSFSVTVKRSFFASLFGQQATYNLAASGILGIIVSVLSIGSTWLELREKSRLGKKSSDNEKSQHMEK